MRLIDADALLEIADEVTFMGFQAVERKKHFMDFVSAMAESCTTIDAVPVVRCKDCVLHGNCLTEDTFNLCRIENPFCCGGKRKDGEG
jgi:hypothetical protein